MLSLIGVKLGMTRLFSTEGKSLPITLIKVFFNRIYSDNEIFYNSVYLFCNFKKKLKFTKSTYKYYIKFIKKKSKKIKLTDFDYNYNLNNSLINIFYINQYVDVTGISIGKGFSGVIKRYNFKSGRASHGNSKSHNTPGSIGMNQDPGRVFSGKKLPGHLGSKKYTVKNLKIKKIDFNYNVFYITGNTPGYTGSVIFISSSIK